MKILDGQVALGGKSGTKALGEHKASLTSTSPVLRRSARALVGWDIADIARDHLRLVADPLQFWKTQPVPQLPGPDSAPNTVEEGPIDPVKTPSEVKQEPGALPSGFVWSQIDIMNDEQVSRSHLPQQPSICNVWSYLR